jgi:TrmH family RNA methyltransferase
MLSINRIKFIQSLSTKKNRLKHGVFVVEGEKNVLEFISSQWEIESIYGTEEWTGDCQRISQKELDRISFLKSPNKVLAVVKIPTVKHKISGQLVIALDGVKDPGNFGTIIRLADWFGVKHILCSKDCVELYNPKVVQSTMGSIARVQVHYVDLVDSFTSMNDYSVYSMVLNGEELSSVKSDTKKILVMGGESNGISQSVLNNSSNLITISKHPDSKTESLNVANASAIALFVFSGF